jgi:flagella basal body P-ring formation protein FlgA
MVARGELVRVYAVAGRLETVFRNAEAMQNGNLGDFIKLKNRDSGQEIVGQVVSPGAVRIRIR